MNYHFTGDFEAEVQRGDEIEQKVFLTGDVIEGTPLNDNEVALSLQLPDGASIFGIPREVISLRA